MICSHSSRITWSIPLELELQDCKWFQKVVSIKGCELRTGKDNILPTLTNRAASFAVSAKALLSDDPRIT